MSIDYTSTAIVVVLVGALMFFLRKAARKKPSYSTEGVMLLKFSGGYKVIGYISIGVACLFAVALAINIYKTLDIFLILGGIILLFLALGLWLVLYAALTWVECDEQKVRFHGMGGKVREIAWHEVSSVKFNKRTLELSLIGPTSQVKVHAHMVGFPTFVELIKKKLDSQLYSEAFKQMARRSIGWDC